MRFIAQCEEEMDLYHYDTPLTKELQRRLLCSAGFRRVVLAYEVESTAIFVAQKR